MKIIDAHMHLFPADSPHAEESAGSVGHKNSIEHLRKVYDELGLVHAVVMGNHNLDEDCASYPPELFHYCVGMDSMQMAEEQSIDEMLSRIEYHLKRDMCCGVKLYPGYNRFWLSDEPYQPIYAMAAKHDKPVAVHMGQTAFPGAHLKYCHPLALDEVAADNPDTRFIMCHFGNPFLEAASAVTEKNPNVAVDLSGLLEGRIDLEQLLRDQSGYIFLLKAWLGMINCWDRIMFGTDWPVVNIAEYIAFIEALVPESHREKVFFHNANRIYGLGL